MDGIDNTIITGEEQLYITATSPSSEEITDVPETVDAPETTVSEPEVTEETQRVQDAEINRRNAAARRRAENERRMADLQAEADRRVKEAERNAVIAATGGKVSPYTGKLIESVEELNAYNAAFDAENSRRKLQQSGIDPKDLDALISQHPTVQKAQAAVQSAEQANAAARQQMRQRLIEQDVAEIGKIDPSIKTLDDLLESPIGAETDRLVKQRGLSYLEAFKLANFDRVSTARVAAIEKASAEKSGGKAHMTSTAQKAPDTVSVPSETMQMYRNAGFTEKEAREKYAQYLNSKKKG